MSVSRIRIVPYLQLEPSAQLEAALHAIFFQSSGTTTFPDEAARRAFRHRWLGRYLQSSPAEAFVAVDGPRTTAGYLVGSLLDPALDPDQQDLGYVQSFAPVSRTMPAHLHINLAPAYRSGGIGGRLIETFAAHAGARGASGMHVVTGRGMRNVGFYLRNGFEQLAETEWRGRPLVLLGRRL